MELATRQIKDAGHLLRRQRGAFAIMFSAVLIVILGVCGLALELGQAYNRKAELQGIAQAVALAAARELNGTAAGVTAAQLAAGATAGRLKVRYGEDFTWDDSAIRFSNTPAAGAEWIDAASARTSPANRYYVQVDTRALGQDLGLVESLFIAVLPRAQAGARIGERAVAGRSTIHVLPLAVCAMSDVPAAARVNPGPPETVELVEYGFRRGVGYDLMQLNPGAATPISFVIDPLAPPGGLGSASNTGASAVAPFICSGRMWTARVTGGMIRVGSPFPIASLYRELNARFDQYSGSRCKPNGSPPDWNIRAYTHGAGGGAAWMNPRATVASATSATDGGRLQTIADLPAPPAGTAPGAYGPLWSYARAARFSAYVPGAAEPPGGYASFGPSDWSSLYPSTPATGASGYPGASQPNHASTGANYGAPSAPNTAISVLGRRVLHIPLLQCPVAAGANVGASARAVGKFFMTVPATATSLYAEFAGLIPEDQLTGQVILYP